MSLHVHSDFSALDGWSTVDEIGDRMLEIGRSYCGLTDHGVVSGHLDFDKAMRKRKITPVYGCELYAGTDFTEKKKKERDQAHLIALAMTDEGLKNLWRLVHSTSDRRHFHHVGRVSREDLEKYNEGIIFTSACPIGLVPQGLLKGETDHLNWYLNHLDFRIEVTTYPGDADWSDIDSEGDPVTPKLINELLVGIAQERGIPIVYGDDGHYAFESDFPYHDMYLARQMGQSVYTSLDERKMYHPPGAVCIKDENMVRESLHYLPDSLVDEIITNTDEIGEKADAHLPDIGKPHLPVFIPRDCPWVEKDIDPTSLFVDLVEEGITRIYGGTERESEAWARAIHEMDVLTQDGLENYFLMAWDVMQFCDKEGINRGPGRGSSAGSIVAYALGITDVDPLHYDLIFERFWNQGRTDGFPDIDSDFARSRRPEIREYLIKRWGEDRVCSIGTNIRLKPIETINKLAACCGISMDEMSEIKTIVEKTHDIEIHGPDQIGWSSEVDPGKIIYVKDDVGEDIDKWVDNDDRRRAFIEMCEHACSRNANYGIHPSGIVVSDIDLPAFAPAYRRGGKDGVPATMFPMDDIEKLKLLKMDALGLKTLDTLEEWVKQMKEKGINIDWSGLDRQEWPVEMWDLLDEGFTAGIFQIETPGGKQLTEKLKPRSVDDLGILVALNRPGPQRARDERGRNVPKRYVDRKAGREPVSYPHPMLEELLKPTYGLFIYQEQIIRFMGELGYSLNDADSVRKILGKKQREKLSDFVKGFKEWDQKGFLEVAINNGFDRKVAEQIWKELEEFASYSFNKAHSIAYGILAFRGLLAKYFGPSEFYIACIRTVEQKDRAERTPQYIREARRMNIKVLPPNILFSRAQISVHDDDIYFGFGDVANVAKSGDYMVYLRDEKKLDVSSPEIFLEGLEEFSEEENQKKRLALKEGKPFPASWRSPKQQINAKKVGCLLEAGAWDDQGEREISLSNKQKLEEKLLGVILTDNSQAILAANIDNIAKCDDWAEAILPWTEKESEYEWVDDYGVEIPSNKRFIIYKLPGTISEIKPTKVRASGAAMGIITIEYDRYELQFACFSQLWKTHKFLFKPRATGIFTIRHTAPNEKRKEGWHFEQGKLLQ